MGMMKLISDDSGPPTKGKSKLHPWRFELIQSKQIGGYLVLELKYPECKNYEGTKILVVIGHEADFKSRKHFDPHFLEYDDTQPFTVARFVPIEGAFQMACDFTEMITKGKP
jgi:hypothetical protein